MSNDESTNSTQEVSNDCLRPPADFSFPCVLQIVRLVGSGDFSVSTFRMLTQQVDAGLAAVSGMSSVASAPDEGLKAAESADIDTLCEMIKKELPEEGSASVASVNPMLVALLMQLLEKAVKSALEKFLG